MQENNRKFDKNGRTDAPREDVIYGRNPVSEAIRSGRAIDSVLVARGAKTGAIVGILAKAKERNLRIKEVDPKKLDYMCAGGHHQGIAVLCAVCEYKELEDIFALAEERGEAPFVIVLDELEDPHNLGAIIRTAECAGAHGVIIPNRRSAGLSFTVGKSSAGAVEYVPVVRVPNIPSVLDTLKERGLWVYGADMDGEDYRKCDMGGAIALVIGNEGKGIGRLVREKCDVIVSLPMKGKINSLNASVAAGILMYRAADCR
ncbi:MAG: 23S rRNA (guanosine(2251)-2'-O)-methyltransferase RlmB [Eubacteriales bacterium]|nr:23S rRNA (guanosine(2251)-2'-O)-methyltransferase RlmB [Eubacteriales bacterium]